MLALVLSLPPELVDGVNEARHRVGTEGWVDALLKVVSVRFAFSAKAAFPFLPRVAKTGELFPPKLMVRARKKKKTKKNRSTGNGILTRRTRSSSWRTCLMPSAPVSLRPFQPPPPLQNPHLRPPHLLTTPSSRRSSKAKVSNSSSSCSRPRTCRGHERSRRSIMPCRAGRGRRCASGSWKVWVSRPCSPSLWVECVISMPLVKVFSRLTPQSLPLPTGRRQEEEEGRRGRYHARRRRTHPRDRLVPLYVASVRLASAHAPPRQVCRERL